MNVEFVGVAQQYFTYVQEHKHNVCEIILNLEGNSTYLINNKEYDFCPGTVLCIPANMPHTVVSENKFKDIFMRADNFPIITEGCYSDDEDKSIRNLMFFALKTYYKKEKNYKEILNAVAETIYQILSGKDEANGKNEDIEIFKNCIIENFTDPEFTIGDAYKKIPYCEGYFRKQFKKSMSVSPLHYLTGMRIEYAKKLLAQNKLHLRSISEISLMSGFYDYRYFSQVFKKSTGKTPFDYQRNHLTNVKI